MASSSRPFVIRMDLYGMRGTLAAFRELPAQASKNLRDETLRVSRDLATHIQAAGMSQGRQARLVAGTVRARRDRVPNVVIGYPLTRKIGHQWPGGQGTSGDLIMGSEFGGRGHGFLAHNGRTGSWIFPTVKEESPRIAIAWQQAAARVAAGFAAGRD